MTKLALLLDECVQALLADQIDDCPGISSIERIDASHLLGNRSTPDEAVVEYARRTRRILVTVEGRLNEHKFRICTHPGIIVIKATNRHEFGKARLFAKFMRSGERKRAKHAVTYLKIEGSLVKTRAKSGEIEEIPIRL